MSKKTFKPLTVADFNLTEDEMRELVLGAQKFLAPPPEEGEASIDQTEPETTS